MNKAIKVIISITLGFFTSTLLFTFFNQNTANPCTNQFELTRACDDFIQGKNNYLSLVLFIIIITTTTLIYFLIINRLFKHA